MRICVLGHRGMLGHMVARYLSKTGFDVLTIPQRFHPDDHGAFLEAVNLAKPDWCINCIGVRESNGTTAAQIFAINAELPQLLSHSLSTSIRLVHASTDGVFQNHPSDRLHSEIPDATDTYGLSKRAAEKAVLETRHFVIRCSIIGPELNTNRSLLSWILSQKGVVQGFTNHLWNGVTSLEWAKICQRLLGGERFGVGNLLQPGFTPACSKYELISRIVEDWKHDLAIEAVESQVAVTRTLIPNIRTEPIGTQLRELRDYI